MFHVKLGHRYLFAGKRHTCRYPLRASDFVELGRGRILRMPRPPNQAFDYAHRGHEEIGGDVVPRIYNSQMEQQAAVDLTGYSFDEFMEFMFARETPDAERENAERGIGERNSEHANPGPWYWKTDVTFVPSMVCEYYTRLFQDPQFLTGRFSPTQLEEGFWAIQGPNLDCSVSRILEDADLTLTMRADCIRAMFDLFKRLFASAPLDTSVSM